MSHLASSLLFSLKKKQLYSRHSYKYLAIIRGPRGPVVNLEGIQSECKFIQHRRSF